MLTILHYFVAFFGGGLVIGYLIAEWYYERLLERCDKQLEADEALFEELGVER